MSLLQLITVARNQHKHKQLITQETITAANKHLLALMLPGKWCDGGGLMAGLGVGQVALANSYSLSGRNYRVANHLESLRHPSHTTKTSNSSCRNSLVSTNEVLKTSLCSEAVGWQRRDAGTISKDSAGPPQVGLGATWRH